MLPGRLLTAWEASAVICSPSPGHATLCCHCLTTGWPLPTCLSCRLLLPPTSFCPCLQPSDSDSSDIPNSTSDYWDPWGEREPRERCFLVGVSLKQGKGKHGYGVQESLEELGRLADTAGLEVMGTTYQMLDVVSAGGCEGRGEWK